ncbi:MAG: DegT/DnrJ/EryC1/StrS family aminotransferase [Pirellulales bacterium]|nr:DegT/DnrJ/EryC1/StrS family aminotransferase [Pirellulales bacterium]
MAAVNDPSEEGVAFFDLRQQLDHIRGEITAALEEVLDSGWFANGPAVARFEEQFAAYCRVPHAVAVNTGTSALHLAMRCLNVGPGDEVVTVALSFVATTWPVLYLGATPVFVDVTPGRYTMDPGQLEKAITPRTKAIVVVHLYGQCADMNPILTIGKAHGIPVVEDCAQAVGAEYKGRRAGSMGAIGCFSFYPSKNLGAYGEGGAVTTNDSEVALRCRRLRDHAQVERYLHSEIGYNYRLNSFQGAILSVKLKYLEDWTERRMRIAAEYNQLLYDGPVVTPASCPDGRHVYHLYVVRSSQRDPLRSALEKRKIRTAVHYPRPIHLQPAFKQFGYHTGDLPVTEEVTQSCVSLPLYPEMSLVYAQRVADVIKTIGIG